MNVIDCISSTTNVKRQSYGAITDRCAEHKSKQPKMDGQIASKGQVCRRHVLVPAFADSIRKFHSIEVPGDLIQFSNDCINQSSIAVRRNNRLSVVNSSVEEMSKHASLRQRPLVAALTTNQNTKDRKGNYTTTDIENRDSNNTKGERSLVSNRDLVEATSTSTGMSIYRKNESQTISPQSHLPIDPTIMAAKPGQRACSNFGRHSVQSIVRSKAVGNSFPHSFSASRIPQIATSRREKTNDHQTVLTEPHKSPGNCPIKAILRKRNTLRRVPQSANLIKPNEVSCDASKQGSREAVIHPDNPIRTPTQTRELKGTPKTALNLTQQSRTTLKGNSLTRFKYIDIRDKRECQTSDININDSLEYEMRSPKSASKKTKVQRKKMPRESSNGSHFRGTLCITVKNHEKNLKPLLANVENRSEIGEIATRNAKSSIVSNRFSISKKERTRKSLIYTAWNCREVVDVCNDKKPVSNIPIPRFLKLKIGATKIQDTSNLDSFKRQLRRKLVTETKSAPSAVTKSSSPCSIESKGQQYPLGNDMKSVDIKMDSKKNTSNDPKLHSIISSSPKIRRGCVNFQLKPFVSGQTAPARSMVKEMEDVDIGVTNKRKYAESRIPSNPTKCSDALCGAEVSPMVFHSDIDTLTKYYAVDEIPLGKGTYGIVKKATHLVTGSARAVKYIDKRNPHNLKRIKKEVELMRELDHPNIIKFFETYDDGKTFYLVLELCSGGELFDKIAANRGMNEKYSANAMNQIFSALSYLHGEKNIAHRDIKPENFIFSDSTEDAVLKIIDFGLAVSARPDQMLKTQAGTPYYVAPEVLAGKYTRACDMWSAGVIMFIVLCGYPPFHGKSDAQILNEVRKGTVEFDPCDWRSISPDAKDLILKLLDKDITTRFTADMALAHKWCQNWKAVTIQRNIVPQYICNKFRGVNLESALKIAALQCIAKRLHVEDMKQLCDLFKELDSDQDGIVARRELKEALIRFYRANDIPDIQTLIRGIEGNKLSEITMSEFFQTLFNIDEQTQKTCIQAFEHFDLDNNGEITKEEVERVLVTDMSWRYASAGARKEFALTLVRDFDLSSRGAVTFTDFLVALARCSLKQLSQMR